MGSNQKIIFLNYCNIKKLPCAPYTRIRRTELQMYEIFADIGP